MSPTLPAPSCPSLALSDVALSRRSALYLIAGTTAALTLAPNLVLGRDEAFADSLIGGYESFAESWRYSGGEVVASPRTDVSNAVSLSTLSTTETYSTWTADNGTTSYLIRTDTTADAEEEDEEEVEEEADETEDETEDKPEETDDNDAEEGDADGTDEVDPDDPENDEEEEDDEEEDAVVTTYETVTVSGVARVGIDASRWQGDIDWSAVAADGISFAIIRCGYGSDFEDQDDPCFLQNVQGARDNGLDIGLYLYSYATKTSGDDGSAASEAAHVLRLLDEAGLEPDDLDLPIFLDMENSTQAELDTATIGNIARVFCNTLVESGYKVGIYANKYWWTTYLTDEVFATDKWYKWVARYPTTTASSTSNVDDTTLWQFTCKGVVSGIEGDVDVDFDYLGKGNYGVAEVVESERFDATPTLSWRAHVQTYGWTSGSQTMPDTVTLGTTGLSKRIEAFELSLSDTTLAGSITYRAHVQTYGWQSWVSDGATAGTTGLSKRVESLQIKLTGELAEAFDVYYRVHVQTFGWLGWAKNGASAGSSGYSKRAEAIQIALVRKGESAPGSTSTPYVNEASVSARAHMQTYGWLDWADDGATVGVTGLHKRMEALQITLSTQVSGSITYRAHVQTYGWQSWVSDGATAGTTGLSKRVEAVNIKLTGDAATYYDVWYRVHSQTYGWLDWACNGEMAGTSGLSKRLEAIQIKVLAKNSSAPGSTTRPSVIG